MEVEEACEIVKHIEDYRVKSSAEDPSFQVGVLDAQYCLGMLYFYIQDWSTSRNYFARAARGGAGDHEKQPSVTKSKAMLQNNQDVFGEYDGN